eukprot:477227_1
MTNFNKEMIDKMHALWPAFPCSTEKHCNEPHCTCNETFGNESTSIIVRSWREYAICTMSGNRLFEYFKEHLHSSPSLRVSISHCSHHRFRNELPFINCLIKYCTNDQSFKMDLDSNGISSCSFKDGICDQCALQFIVFTNGLSFIINSFDLFIKDGMKNKAFRKEFHQTNIILALNPIFFRCLLWKANKSNISKIFRLFFIKYLH